MDKDDKEPDPWALYFGQRKARYSKRLGAPSWVEKADVLAVTLHWLKPHLDEANEIQQEAIRQARDDESRRKSGLATAKPDRSPSDYERFLFSFLTVGTVPVFMMLAGYALENLFKGYIVERLPKRADTEGSESRKSKRKKRDLPDQLVKHDLLALSRMIPLAFSSRERGLLAHLSAASTWWGRYPLPISHRDFEHEFPDGIRRETEGFPLDVWSEAMTLVRRVRVELFPHAYTFLQRNSIDPQRLGLPFMPHANFAWDPSCSCEFCPKVESPPSKGKP